jgi:hypothetical protein
VEDIEEIDLGCITPQSTSDYLLYLRLVYGIGMVNLVQSAGNEKDFYPMDYRIYAPDQDGKTQNDHFSEMVTHAVFAKKIKAKRILLDSWYAYAENLKLVHRLGLTFRQRRNTEKQPNGQFEQTGRLDPSG